MSKGWKVVVYFENVEEARKFNSAITTLNPDLQINTVILPVKSSASKSKNKRPVNILSMI